MFPYYSCLPPCGLTGEEEATSASLLPLLVRLKPSSLSGKILSFPLQLPSIDCIPYFFSWLTRASTSFLFFLRNINLFGSYRLSYIIFLYLLSRANTSPLLRPSAGPPRVQVSPTEGGHLVITLELQSLIYQPQMCPIAQGSLQPSAVFFLEPSMLFFSIGNHHFLKTRCAIN